MVPVSILVSYSSVYEMLRLIVALILMVTTDWLPQWMKQLLCYAKQHLQKHVPYISLPLVRNTCFVLIILYLALSQWKSG